MPRVPAMAARVWSPTVGSLCRTEELQEPWEEGSLHGGLPGRQIPPGTRDFATAVQQGSGLFGKDPGYWQSVHLCGEGKEAEMAAAKRKVRGAACPLGTCTGDLVSYGRALSLL